MRKTLLLIALAVGFIGILQIQEDHTTIESKENASIGVIDVSSILNLESSMNYLPCAPGYPDWPICLKCPDGPTGECGDPCFLGPCPGGPGHDHLPTLEDN